MIVRWTEAGNLHVDEGERQHKVTVIFHGMQVTQQAEKLALLQQVLDEARVYEPPRKRVLQ